MLEITTVMPNMIVLCGVYIQGLYLLVRYEPRIKQRVVPNKVIGKMMLKSLTVTLDPFA
jgi:hypothetical protein